VFYFILFYFILSIFIFSDGNNAVFKSPRRSESDEKLGASVLIKIARERTINWLL